MVKLILKGNFIPITCDDTENVVRLVIKKGMVVEHKKIDMEDNIKWKSEQRHCRSTTGGAKRL